MDIKKLYAIFKQHQLVTTDSRDCQEGAIFFALKGENFNGNQYAKTAIDNGCAYAVVDEPEFANQDERIIFVDDSLKALQMLAREHRRELKTPIVAVTGTNGKTTTKELIAAVLAKKFNILYTKGNFNNHIGVPKTLLQLKLEHEIAVVEMGANHPGEIKTLVDIAEPNYGIITNVGKAHLLGFGSFEGVIRTKGELYDFIRNNGGKVFINAANQYLMGISDGLELVKYAALDRGIGNQEELIVSGHLIDCNPYLHFTWNQHEVKTNLIGAYNIDNALAAATIGSFFGVDENSISSALHEYMPSNNRSQLMKTEDNTVIVDAYNANPTSMTAALNNFNMMKADSKMCILGQMGELGDASRQEHQAIIDILDNMHIKLVWLVGKEFKATDHPDKFKVFDDVEQVKHILATQKPVGMTILVKGSNSTRMFELPQLL